MEQSQPTRQWHKVAGISLAGALLIFGIFLATWPVWLEGYAEEKFRALMGSRFEQLEYEEFELERDRVIVRELAVSNPNAHLEFPSLTVSFTPDFWRQRVVIDMVELEGGGARGQLEEFQKLRGSSSKSSSSKSSSRVDLSRAAVRVKEFQLDLEARGYRARGMMAVSSSSLQGPFELELTSSSVARDQNVLVSADLVTSSFSREAPFPLEFQLEGLKGKLSDVAIKDVQGSAVINDKDARLLGFDLVGKTEEGQRWLFAGWINRLTRTAQGRVQAQGIKPSQLPVELPVELDRGTITVDLNIVKEGDLVIARGTSTIRDLQVYHRRLAKNPVILGGSFDLDAQANLEMREFQLRKLTYRPLESDLQLEARARVLWAPELRAREFELELSMGQQPCQAVLEALPPGFAPALEGFELEGETSLELKTEVKMSDPDATVLEGGLDLDGCELRKVPDTVAALNGPFMHLVRMKNGTVIERPLIQGHFYYAPWDRIPAGVADAVLSTEDSSFWYHNGFRPAELYASLRRNVELGTFRRGASTLTMQMVKNVLLTHEKTVSRKIQELFLTWVVEESLPKERILEIYLNVVEFGPAIFGIADAADHYFGKSFADLTSLEAAFLATLLPRPIERHEMWCRGALTPKHEKYVHRVHRRMLGRKRISQEEFDQAEAQGIHFSRLGWTSEASCIAESKRIGEGTHVQGALSGLLAG